MPKKYKRIETMASSTEFQLILAKLSELTAVINELKAIQGSNAIAMADRITDSVKSGVIAEINKSKEKKKTATGESKDGVVNHAPKKKTHPHLNEVTEKAWIIDEKGATDFDKRTKWFISVMNKHRGTMVELLGEDLIKEVESSESYMANMIGKKNDTNTRATAFFRSIRTYMTKKNEAQWVEVSKRLVDKYNTEKVVYDSTGLPQAKTESAGSAEASAAAALVAAGLGAPVTMHTSTANPAAQLAAV